MLARRACRPRLAEVLESLSPDERSAGSSALGVLAQERLGLAQQVGVVAAAQAAVAGEHDQVDPLLVAAREQRVRVGLDASPATAANISVSFAAYGRARSAASCARRSFAAATIFMALVICCVERTVRSACGGP